MSAARPAARWPWLRLAVLVLAALAIAVGWGGFGGGGPIEAESREPAGQKVWGASVGFASARRLDEHFDKHGAEFGRIAKAEYLKMAQTLRDRPVGGSVLELKRSDGVVTRFDRTSGAFLAFNSDGVIRTFFKPNDGERYFRRQAERDG
ncbi:MAG: hypothetical protein FJX02_12990 [Alphaproteobacteria bacterium]|nr:hypothetical protein [Alphaproteobacteria bacterium]